MTLKTRTAAGCLWLAAAPLLAGGAAATPLKASDLLSGYNLITGGSVSQGQDIEGKAIIGGSLSGSGTFFNNNVPTAPSVSVYGSVSGNFNLNAGGNLYVGGAVSGNINYNGGGKLVPGGPVQPITDYTSPLAQLANNLASLTNNGSYTTANNTLTFKTSGTGVSVIVLKGSALDAAMASVSNIAFSIGPGVSSVIIDVLADNGTTFTEPSGTNWNGSPLRDVLFNFIGYSKVTVGNWQSSLMAEGATVAIANGAINGTVVAQSFTGGGELHNYTFTGALPDFAAVPEPASAGLIAMAGVALTGWLRRRRRAPR